MRVLRPDGTTFRPEDQEISNWLESNEWLNDNLELPFDDLDFDPYDLEVGDDADLG